MNHMKKLILPSLTAALASLTLQAQTPQKDTSATEASNSAIFLNAESDSKPREVSLGPFEAAMRTPHSTGITRWPENSSGRSPSSSA